MTVYEHRASITAVAGSVCSAPLNIGGGLCRQVLIRSTTASTVFRADLTDSNAIIRRHYAFHTGEINDMGLSFPMVGNYTINVTNASPNDTFTVVVAVQE